MSAAYRILIRELPQQEVRQQAVDLVWGIQV